MNKSLFSPAALGLLGAPTFGVVEADGGGTASAPSIPVAVPSSIPTTDAHAVSPEVANLIADLSKAPGIGQEIYAAYRTKGAQGALSAALTHIADATATFHDFTAALPAIKSGYKTSEFWLTIGYAVGAQVITLLNPHLSPTVVNILEVSSAVLPVVYTLSRALVKINTHATAPAVAPAVGLLPAALATVGKA